MDIENQKEGIVVLSLFDGISCGQVALKELGFKIDKYFASEIDKYAIGVTQYKHPDTIQIGNVKDVYYIDEVLCTPNGIFEVGHIDLIIGGSPCTDFSVAGKGAGMSTTDKIEITTLDQYLELKSKGFEFQGQSYLFWEYVRLMRETNAKYFFLENVRMVDKWKNLLSKTVGVNPIFLDSNLVSAQNRKRFYWTNIKGYVEPKDYGVLLKDIVHESEFVKDINIPNFNINPSGKGINGVVRCVNNEKSTTITTNKGEGSKISVPTDKYIVLNNTKGDLEINIPEATKKGYAGVGVGVGVDLTFPDSKTRRGRLMEGKCNCLTAASYDYNIVEELRKYIVPFDQTLQILEKEVQRGKVGFFRKDSQANRVYYIHDKAVTLTGESGGGAAKMGQYLFGCITPDRIEKRQNGQRFSSGKKFYTLTAQDKHGILIEGYIRKLTPIECERLQTLYDDYTKYGIINKKTVNISDSQRYKMLGNGWTIEAVKQFFKNLPYPKTHQETEYEF